MALIDLEGITRVYRSGTVAVEALKGVDLAVDEGEFVAVMGASGSGKSTLMNIVGCLDRATEGRYVLAGENVSTLSRDRLAGFRNRLIGFVFQDFSLLPRTTALENVELPLLYAEEEPTWKEMHERAAEALERVGLGDRMDHKPNELSGGQRQRVAIARALVNNPSILLADEPTGNLDTKTGQDIMRLFEELYRAGNTILLVTHEDEIAHHARHIIRMRDGNIESDTKVENPEMADLEVDIATA